MVILVQLTDRDASRHLLASTIMRWSRVNAPTSIRECRVNRYAHVVEAIALSFVHDSQGIEHVYKTL